MILYNYDVLWLSLHDSTIICYTSINTLTVYYNRLFICKMRVYSAFQKLINNSWAKHKENHSREGVFICDKTHVDFHKTFASILSAYTTSMLKILSETKWQDGYKIDRFETIQIKHLQFVLYQI